MPSSRCAKTACSRATFQTPPWTGNASRARAARTAVAKWRSVCHTCSVRLGCKKALLQHAAPTAHVRQTNIHACPALLLWGRRRGQAALCLLLPLNVPLARCIGQVLRYSRPLNLHAAVSRRRHTAPVPTHGDTKKHDDGVPQLGVCGHRPGACVRRCSRKCCSCVQDGRRRC